MPQHMKSQIKIQGKIRAFRNVENTWQFWINDATVMESISSVQQICRPEMYLGLIEAPAPVILSMDSAQPPSWRGRTAEASLTGELSRAIPEADSDPEDDPNYEPANQ